MTSREKISNRYVICAEKFEDGEVRNIVTFRRTFRETLEAVHSLKSEGFYIDSVEEKQLSSIWTQVEIEYKKKFGGNL